MAEAYKEKPAALQGCLLRGENSLRIISNDGKVTLKLYTLADAKEAFDLIDRNRSHLSQFGDITADKYPTLECFKQSILNLKDPNKLRFGIRNSDGILVGSINLAPDNHNFGSCEIGYYLGREFQGHGYMTRAVKALEDYAFDALGYREIRAVVREGNEASSKVLLRCGYMKRTESGDEITYIKTAWG
jgi:RimJ/RimL family protein N-acetyltransferase